MSAEQITIRGIVRSLDGTNALVEVEQGAVGAVTKKADVAGSN
jgi:hypothetical protein